MKLEVYFQCVNCNREHEYWFDKCSCGCYDEVTYVLCDCGKYRNDREKCECK